MKYFMGGTHPKLYFFWPKRVVLLAILLILFIGKAATEENSSILIPKQKTQKITFLTPSFKPVINHQIKKENKKRMFVNLAKNFVKSTTLARKPFQQMARQTLILLPSDRNLPLHLQGKKHWDYPLLVRWVPRSLTTFDWGKPTMIIGNQNYYELGSPKPIGEKGSFQISAYSDLPIPLCWVPLYFSFTTKRGKHFRFGARWDDVDMYVTIPSVAIKQLK